MGLDAGRDGLAGAGVEAAIASLADRPPADDLLVADRHRLRPPAVNAEFMFDVGGDLVCRLLLEKKKGMDPRLRVTREVADAAAADTRMRRVAVDVRA